MSGWIAVLRFFRNMGLNMPGLNELEFIGN